MPAACSDKKNSDESRDLGTWTWQDTVACQHPHQIALYSQEKKRQNSDMEKWTQQDEFLHQHPYQTAL